MTLDQGNITWTETSPGFWERGLDEGEKNYKNLETLFEGSGRVFFAITGHVSVQVPVPSGQDKETESNKVDAALRKAWVASRYDYPTIASHVVYNPTKPFFREIYQTPKSEDDVQSWLDASFVPIESEQTGTDWANTDPPVPKMPTVFVLSPPSSSNIIRRDLVLRSPHEMIDGIGTMHLWNTLIRHASLAYQGGGSWLPPALDGSETKSLSPPYRVAAAIPVEPTEIQKRKIDAIAAELTTPITDIQVLSIPFRQGSLTPNKHQRLEHRFSAQDTDRMLERCREAGVTITHAFHAAIAMAVRDLQPPQKEHARGRYTSWILRNERPYCQAPYNTEKHAAAAYHSISGRAIHVDVDLPTFDDSRDSAQERHKDEFLDIMQQFRTFYDSIKNDPDHYALVCAICALFTPPIPDAELAPNSKRPVPPPRDLPSVSLSSLGRIDDKVDHSHGEFQLHDPWVTGEELMNGYGCFLGTFRGELVLSGVYNDAWHDADEMSIFLKRCVSIVFEGLGLSQDV
ncbi:hypothetical protein FZEAL_6187 [Fusarium zealandicum]|uniref:Uncharacterized protein n=1 Tax=Fusarium zealandicum TaxID=1053134 RepID=A0A8H4UIA9_9HYPO|nr:hypothetical protein FZEAL_6187 [Fusarium zealandicum]